jgi:hypothetical protein
VTVGRAVHDQRGMHVRRTRVAQCGLVLAMLALAQVTSSTAAASSPTRQPFVPPIPAVDTDCGYPIGIDVLTSQQVLTTFSDGRMLITGSAKIRVTNLDDPSKTMLLNVSGPSQISADGSTFVGVGSAGGPTPGGLPFVDFHGRIVVQFDANGNVISEVLTGHLLNVCQILQSP